MSTVFSPEPALTTCRARAVREGCRNSVCPLPPIRSSASISPGFSLEPQNVKASEKLAALVGASAGTQMLMPTAVLFNGGVFKAAPIRTGCLICWRPGMGASQSANCRVSNQTSLSHAAERSTDVSAPLARACASRPARRGPTTSAWKRRCPPFRATSRRLRHCVLSRRGCRKARNC